MEKYFVSLIAVIVTVSLATFAFAQETFSAGQGVWLLEGRLVTYTSVCDLPKELSPFSATVTARTEVKVTVTGCTNLEAELQHPFALIVRILNSTDSSRAFTIPFPSNVIIHDSSFSREALALYWPVKPKGWSTAGSGIMEMELEPDSAVEFLYLIPRFGGKATIELADIGSFEITFYPPPSFVVQRKKMTTTLGAIKSSQ